MACSIFVEGKPDKALIECILDYKSIEDVEVEMIGGGVSKLGSVANQVRRRHDSGRTVALILDADQDLDQARTDCRSEIDSHELHVDGVFFLPDNESGGCLEDLLQMISLQEHSVVYDCFADYEDCLRRTNPSYRLPRLKGRIYAYCESVGGINEMKSRDNPVLTACRDASFWDLEAPAVQPLIHFLGRWT